MSVSKPMKEVSVEEILEQYNLIVPEIQREYVWGLNHFGIFETFLKDIKEGFNSEGEISTEIMSLQQTIKNPLLDEATKLNLVTLLEGIRKPQASMNIGFLYSYKPGYYIGNDREEDLYLIDGQQRFTTLFLILFYFSLKEHRKDEFLELFKFDIDKEKIAFDYRVRSITHQFIIELVALSNNIDDLLTVRQKSWFLASFANDTTVKSIGGTDVKAGVFNLMQNFFGEDNREYFDFVKRNIKFWHFKTEATSHGEELYITMNSRGQQLADNETIRAKLFDDDQVRENALYWSEQWEIWQDFFWKHRNRQKEGISADEGFNEFLRWVQILNMWEKWFKQGSNSVENSKNFERTLQWERGSQLDYNFLFLKDIELSFNAVKYLYGAFGDVQASFKKLYPRSYKKGILPTGWIATDGNPLELINLFQLLPIILYCKKSLKESGNINELTLFRLIKAISTLSKDVTIRKAVRNQVDNVLFFADTLSPVGDIVDLLTQLEISKTILNEELTAKLELVGNSLERERLEDAIWFAENLPYNNGEVLHMINLSKAMCNENTSFDVVVFENVIKAFEELMKFEEDVNGNILHTDSYLDLYDRIEVRRGWYKKNGFLDLVKKRANSFEGTLQAFLKEQQKNFIRQYESHESIYAETSSAKQLFIYYILSTNYISGEPLGWNWNGHYNFGKLGEVGDKHILFDSGHIFQFYKSAFRENEYKVLPIHRSPDSYALKLMHSWALT